LNTSGVHNVATGQSALSANTTGNGNVAMGRNALRNATGTRNVALGSGAGQNLTTGSHNVAIANDGIAGEAGTIQIGTNGTQTATFIAGIRGTPLGSAKPVVVNSNGQLGVAATPATSTASLAATVECLQRQVERLRARVKGG
jgi:hypothetical protein